MTTAPLAIVVVVTDGLNLRTIHPRGFGPARAGAIEQIVRAHLAEQTDAPATSAPPPEPAGAAMMTQREIAASQGFTGDVCTTCGQAAMKRAGTCLTCQACGSTTGCG